MSSATRSRQSSEVDIYDDNSYYAHSTVVHHQYRPDPLSHSVLGDLPPGHIQNNIKTSVDSLTADLGRLHIRSNSTKENTFEQEQIAKTRGRKARPQVEFSTFQVPISTQEEVEEPSFCGSVDSDPGAVASCDLPKSESMSKPPFPKRVLTRNRLPSQLYSLCRYPGTPKQPGAAVETPRRSVRMGPLDSGGHGPRFGFSQGRTLWIFDPL